MKRMGKKVSGQAFMVVVAGIVGTLLLTACDKAEDETVQSQQGNSSGMVSGTVSYRERIALPPDAVAEVMLLDVSRQDVAATTIAEQIIDPAGQVPIAYELVYDTAAIDPRMEYAVRATIRRGDSLLFVTDRSYPVLTRGNPDSADLVLVRSGGGAAPVADAGFDGTRWQLRSLAGERVNPGAGEQMYFLQFDAPTQTVSGFVGCNSFTGQYTVTGSALAFGNLARTMRACPSMAVEDRFHGVLQATERYEIRSTWLILLGPDGELATFEAWYE
ncbi:MAG: YbaY family lipoprotein [Woeseiaceae bacterium]|nr:YbaY family lipoprotein [Woeseiaceae bacterium]